MFFTYLFMIVGGIAASAILYGMFALMVRQIIALIKGDKNQFERLMYSHDDVVLLTQKDFGISAEEFERLWNNVKMDNPNAVPYDIYINLKNQTK